MKYERYQNDEFSNTGDIKSESMLSPDETVLWKGKPKKSTFVLENIIAMFPLALIWLLFDSAFIIMFISLCSQESEVLKFLPFIILFFAVHLAPVWIWLYRVLTSSKRWKNTEYVVTDRRVMVKGGLVSVAFTSIKYTDILDVSVHIGVIDKITHVGDVTIRTSSRGIVHIIDIEDPYKVFKMLDQAVIDIQSDIEYPNAFRPGENPGYKTRYKNDDEF